MNSLPRLTRDATAQLDALRRSQTLAAMIGARWLIAMTVGFASPAVREAFDAAIRAAQAEVEKVG